MDDLRLATLMCTRLCHDLVGPVGAIANGLELLAEAPDDEVVRLVRDSAEETARRLRFFRAAFGVPGKAGGLDEARALAAAWLDGGRVRLAWQAGGGEPTLAPLVLNLVLMASECLPRGGSVEVALAPTPTVAACGTPAVLAEPVRAALAGAPLAEAEARHVVPHFARRLAHALGGELTVSETAPERVAFAVRFAR